MKLKNILNIAIIFCAIAICVLSQSCSKDDEPGSDPSEILGSWYGTIKYYNHGTKYQYITLRFNESYIGELEVETPVSYLVGSFEYTYSGNKIVCNGVTVNSNGDTDTNFSMTLTKKGDRLLPQDRFSVFILTRDGSVITDTEGNEIE